MCIAPSSTFRALQHLRHSYASRSADIAAPHLLIMPQLHLDALHAAASVLRIMLASLSLHLVPSQCRCKPCSALLAAAFFAYISLSYNLNSEHDLRRRRHHGPQHRAQARIYRGFSWGTALRIQKGKRGPHLVMGGG